MRPASFRPEGESRQVGQTAGDALLPYLPDWKRFLFANNHSRKKDVYWLNGKNQIKAICFGYIQCAGL